ncbi:MAG: metallophosphoesterase family protein [Phycisphaeraceae bacterium]|nr:metallophosphoesterase family protein [Phycisphaeraceae bacterium]
MTRLGLLSDSHGRAATTRKAVALLQAHGAEVLIHLGDLGGVDVIDALLVPGASPGDLIEAHIVFGNVDWDADDLERYARAVGIKVGHPMGRLTRAGKRIAFTHGHLHDCVEQAITDHVDYLLVGHTHQARDQRVGITRVINPGALFRAAAYTVAILDVQRDHLELITLPEG